MKKLLLLLFIGITILSCEKEKKLCPAAIEKTFSLTGFTKITAAETFSVHITRGAVYSIKAKGCADDLSELALAMKPGGFLDIQYTRYRSGRYKVEFEITMPQLTSINLAGAAVGTISGFGGQPTLLHTVLSGTAQCTIDGLPIKVEAANSGTSVLNISGNADELKGIFSGDARLNAYTALVTTIDVYTSGTAKVYITAGQNLMATATGSSRIYYRGNPTNRQVEETGNGKVIHD